jgi:hypothetical protein
VIERVIRQRLAGSPIITTSFTVQSVGQVKAPITTFSLSSRRLSGDYFYPDVNDFRLPTMRPRETSLRVSARARLHFTAELAALKRDGERERERERERDPNKRITIVHAKPNNNPINFIPMHTRTIRSCTPELHSGAG